MTGEPPGADRDVGAGQGRQMRGQTDARKTSDTGMQRGAQRQAAEAGSWWVWAPSR